jgi:amino acid adenylation domain-containing protein
MTDVGPAATGHIPLRTGAGPAPLSWAQQRLWFLDQAAPDNPFYNCDVVLPLGAVDPHALGRAFAQVVARHDQLRTAFVATDDGPRQLVRRSGPKLRLVDLRRIAPGHRESAARTMAERQTRTPFDLAAGDLARATLIRIDRDHHLLVLVIHHIVCDGWSIGVLLRDLWAYYGAEADRRPGGEPHPDVPALPISYADYAAWQRSWLTGDRLAEQLDYWCTTLAGASDLRLPTDRFRPPSPSYRGDFLPVVIPPAVTERVRALAAQEGATTFMVLIAAFAALLGRCAGTDDVLLGAPIANRTRAETEDLVGFFVNTVALRVSLAGDPTFRELVGRARDTALDAYRHQDLPFEQVVERLRPDRDLTRNPLVQVVAQHFQTAPTAAVSATGATHAAEAPALARGTAKFDLRLDTWDAGDTIRGQLEYALDLFDPGTAEVLLASLRRLLEWATARPDTPVAEIGLAPTADRGLAERRWNDTRRPYDCGGGIHCLVEQRVRSAPDRVAILEHDWDTTYRELWRRSGGVATALAERGVQRGTGVGVALDRGADLLVAQLGVLRAGGHYVPLDPGYPTERLQLMLEDGRPVVVLTRPGLLDPSLEATAELVDVTDLPPRDDGPCLPSGPDDAAYLMYTSGSTGRPKGVLVPHRGIVRLACEADYVELGPPDVVGLGSNVSFDASTFEVWAALANGARLVTLDRDTLLDPARLRSRIRETGMSVLFLTTTLWTKVVEEQPDAFATLDTLLTGGSVCDIPAARRMYAAGAPRRFLNMYGPTENSTFSTAHLLTGPPAEDRTIPIGRPIANSTAYVVDDRGRPVPTGLPGELWVGGDGVALGYHQRPDQTRDRFVSDPFAPGRLAYRTGDRVRRRPDGELEFLGRFDRQVKIRGFRVELAEVEAALRAHPLVGDVLVHAAPDTARGTRLVAYVRPQPPSPDRAQPDRAQPDPAGPTARRGRTPDDELVEQWRDYYEEVLYRPPAHDRDDGQPVTEDLSGWLSSYTGEALPRATMREQIEATAALVLEESPRRVLDIGCGTGLIAHRVASEVRRYVGTDVSPSAVARLRATLAADRLRARVRVETGAADAVAELDEGDFDVVLLNSVVQYFPSAAYLRRVLAGAVAVTAPGGRVIVGDVRYLPLLRPFHASVTAVRGTGGSLAEFERTVDERVEQDNELVLSAEVFHRLADEVPGITAVTVDLKRGRADSELTRFRLDVALRVGGDLPEAPARTLPWGPGASLDRLAGQLRDRAVTSLLVPGIPNARLAADAALLARLAVLGPDDPVGSAPAGARDGIDPEDVRGLGGRAGYAVHLAPSVGREVEAFDAVFLRRRLDGSAPDVWLPPRGHRRPGAAETTDPARGNFLRRVVPELRDFALSQLPDHMLPAAWVLVPTFPVNANGKIDVDRLPPPDGAGATALGAHEAPRTDLERTVAQVVAAAVGLDRVGIAEGFFAELGGNSLTATKVVARLRRHLGVEVPVRLVFEHPTVAGLARAIQDLRDTAPLPGTADDSGLDGVGPGRVDGVEGLADTDVDRLSDAEVAALLRRLSPESPDGR